MNPRGEPKAVPGVVVAVTDRGWPVHRIIKQRFSLRSSIICRSSIHLTRALLTASCVFAFCYSAQAAVLPEDRADILYHLYDGGGVTIDGPSLLVRKSIKDKVSISANYYVDMVSSASIDVLSQGSAYTEERTEYSTSIDYLADKSIISLSYANSSESDYEAETVGFSVSQDFFGDLTTLSLSYAQGNDIVLQNVYQNGQVVDSIEKGEVLRRRFSFGLTQILTKNWIIAFNAESVVDDGFLNNPYRSVRYFFNDGGNLSVGWQPENYPSTRNSDAAALRSMYYLPYRASIRLEGRAFSDSWGIRAQNYELRYTHPLNDELILEFKARSYDQTGADFYADIFSQPDAFEFMARDKELSDFDSKNFGIGLSYEFKDIGFLDKLSASVMWDFMQFNYLNFNDATLSRSNGTDPAPFNPGQEPAYTFEANVWRVFISGFY